MKLTKEQKLLRAIATAIQRTNCVETDAVQVLLSTAAGMAAAGKMCACFEFSSLAHSMFHHAEQVFESRVKVPFGHGGFDN